VSLHARRIGSMRRLHRRLRRVEEWIDNEQSRTDGFRNRRFDEYFHLRGELDAQRRLIDNLQQQIELHEEAHKVAGSWVDAAREIKS
jgi:hypothetical protein